MTSAFIPDRFVVPIQLDTPDFLLRVLDATYADLDFEAVLASKPTLRGTLRGTFSGNWPDDVHTFADNLRDILEHVDDFQCRRGFTYTVLDPKETRCLGCIYIYPCAKTGFDAAVYYWMRADLQGTDLEIRFETFLRHWLSDSWPFACVAYPGRDIPWSMWLMHPDKEVL